MLAVVLFTMFACRATPPTAGDSGDSGSGGPDPYDVEVGPYDARVRWTSYGIPHIEAEDYGSLGYGMGYAFARDHGCVLADQVIMVNSERSRWFGDEFLDADFGWKALGVREKAEAGWFALSEPVQQTLVGYAAGYNRYLEEGELDPRCAGEPWVEPIDHIDLLTYYLALGLYGSGAVLVDYIGSGTPPGAAADSRGGARRPPPPLEVFDEAVHPRMGSNGWAIGRDRAAHDGGLLLSNTHFPAEGERKWHEAQLTLTGQWSVYGSSLMGVAVINLGFNEHVAWTHTVSHAPRFTAALLTLDPSDPTRYLYDGQYLDMESRTYTVEVLQPDGSLEPVTRTLYSTRWGPVMNAPVLGWNELYAVAMTDANDNDLAMLETWFLMNRAGNLDEFIAAHRDSGGIPWVHTMAVDETGQAIYMDSSSVPNWSSAAEARYPQWLAEEPLAALFHDYGIYTVDGSDPVFDWVEEEGAWKPGLVPWDRQPRLMRTDFVYNANDNHWLSNPDEPLEGYPMLYGSERTPRTPRTRMNARYLSEDGPGSASGEDGLFTLAEVEAAALGGRGVLAEELRQAVVDRCTGVTEVQTSEGAVDISAACAALAAWDGTVTVDQAGPPVWRELLGSGLFTGQDLKDAGALMDVPFDPDDPVDTPTGLAAEAPVLEALGLATLRLQQAGITPDQPLGEVQFMRKDDEDLPVPGGSFMEGVIAISEYSPSNATLLPVEPHPETVNPETELTVEGYQHNYGNSFILAVQLGEGGPDARAVMTYSQSDDPRSPHFDDQTRLYGQGQMRDVAFTEEEIAADTVEEQVLTLD